MEKEVGIVVYRARNRSGLGLGYKDLVAPVVVGSRAHVVGPEAMVGPGLAFIGTWAEKSIRKPYMHTVVGRAGEVGFPGLLAAEGELHHRRYEEAGLGGKRHGI
jgi:hypothetical protein